MNQDQAPIVILGGGINGMALARELLLNRVPVCLIDQSDIARGTTAYSSRLIHGGLRYLEHGELNLVRESLSERGRLLKLAPDLVRPLELVIPIRNMWKGLVGSAAGFFRLPWPKSSGGNRGYMAIKSGLTMYDFLAGDRSLPGHCRVSDVQREALGLGEHFFAALAYYDAQLAFPELFTVALAQDAKRIAQQQGIAFQLLTYHRTEMVERRLIAHDTHGLGRTEIEPLAIINATGPSGDETLRQLGITSQRLLGGTRGSHIISHKPQLLQHLGSSGIYAEALDGRPVFILPWNDACLIGTTDIPYEGDPNDAVASDEEIEYLIGSVNEILPTVDLRREDITQHYCGVRPLPYVEASSTASIPRGHWLHEHPGVEPTCFSIVGGKLTTCRSLAEQATEQILKRLGKVPQADSRERPLVGSTVSLAKASPIADSLARQMQQAYGIGAASLLPLTAMILEAGLLPADEHTSHHTSPEEFFNILVSGCILHLEAQTLADLVERRLMVLYSNPLRRSTLQLLAAQLAAAGKLPQEDIESEVDRYTQTIHARFGKTVSDD